MSVCADAPKEPRPLEHDEDGSASPRKKRRIESEDEEPAIESHPTTAHDRAGDKIEEELASALGAGIVDTTERPAENGPSQSENSAESAVAPEMGTDLDPDMATVISSIMNHAERVEEQCAVGEQQLGEDTVSQEAPKGLVFVKANSHLKIQSLPILDNLVRLLSSVDLVWNSFNHTDVDSSCSQRRFCLYSPSLPIKTLLLSFPSRNPRMDRPTRPCARCSTIRRKCTRQKGLFFLPLSLISRIPPKLTLFGKRIWHHLCQVFSEPRRSAFLN